VAISSFGYVASFAAGTTGQFPKLVTNSFCEKTGTVTVADWAASPVCGSGLGASVDDWRSAIDGFVDSSAEELRSVRRHLHAHPEPSREEYETAGFLVQRLRDAGVSCRLVCSGRGIIAGPKLEGGPCVALRGDMDALRIQDEKDAGYRSTRAGVMHACGHDAHATMVLGATLALSRCAESLPWPVPWRALFQPAEEVAEGAREMVAEGAVDGVGAIIAFHVAPELPVGRVALRTGVMTAFCQDVDVTIRGSGGHAARPFLTTDPIAAAALFITAVYQSVPRSVDARDPVVVSFGAIAGGTSTNVIPDRVEIHGTLRTMGRASAALVHKRLGQVASGIAEATGAEIDLHFGHETDAVVNDPEIATVCRRAAVEVVGADGVEEIALPSMGGEDFSGYLDRTRGCMMRLGVASAPGAWPPLHTSHFDIDEHALLIGAKILARAAVLLACPDNRSA
jgi:amidohydrolase